MDTLQGTHLRSNDVLANLRDEVHAEDFRDLDRVREFIDRYVTEKPDQARSRFGSCVDNLVADLRAELGLPAGSQPQLTPVIASHVQDLVMGRALATQDTARWAVHHAANQVTMYSGQLVYDADDIFIDGAGCNFLFHRTYKSQGFHNGPLGINWDHSYNLRLREINGGLQLVRASGGFQESAFTRHALYGQGRDLDYWLPPPGEHSVIFAADRLGVLGIACPPGSQHCAYLLRAANGTLYCYEDDPGFPQRYRICRIQDRDGNYLRFTYRPTGGLDGEQIWQVEVNSPYRYVTFASYDDQGHLLVVCDYVGRTWRYQYDDCSDLVAFTMPGGDRYSEGLTERYVYSTPMAAGEIQHKLLQVYDTAGRLAVENEYGSDHGLLSFGRIVCQREGNRLRTFEYQDVALATGLPAGEPEVEEDMPARQTLLVRNNGNPVHHVYNKFGNLIAREEDTWDGGPRRRLLTRYRYNRDGALIASVSPEGRTTYNLYGRDVYMHAAGQPTEEDLCQRQDLDWRTRLGFGNRMAIVRRAHMAPQASLSFPGPLRDLHASGSDSQDIIVKFAYDPDFQSPTSVSHPQFTRSPFPLAVVDRPYANPQFARTLTSLDYDAAGRITRIRYPDTTRRGAFELRNIAEHFLAYDAHGRLLHYEDRAGTRQRLSYFLAPAQALDPHAPKEGYLREHVFDPHDPRTNPRGLNLVTSREVNLVGVVTRLTTPKGNIIDFGIDALNRVTKVTRALGRAVTYSTRYTYCRNQRVERIERDIQDRHGTPLSGGVDVDFLHYDENDNVVREERGGLQQSERLVTRNIYDEGDLHSEVILPRGNRIRIEYDERRQPRRIRRGAGSEEVVENSFRYDGDGFLIEHRDGRKLRTAFAYDAFGRHIATREYDEQGRLVRVMRRDHDKAGNLTVERLFEPDGRDFKLLYHAQYTYDELSQRIEARVRRFPSPLRYVAADVARQDDLVPLSEAVRTLYFFDVAGRVIRIERHGRRLDAAGNPEPQETVLATTYEYNPLGWLSAESDPLGNRKETHYDRHGLVIRVDLVERVPLANSPTGEEVFTTLYGYDKLDRLTSVTDGLGNTTHFEHDSRDAVLSRQDPLGNIVSFEYDVYGRRAVERIQMTDTGLGGGPRPPGSDIVTRYEYDANGNLIRVVDAHGAPTEQSYDSLDRRVALRYTDGATTTYRYDGNDNIVQMRDANGLVHRTTFTPLDQPARREFDGSRLEPRLAVEGPAFEAFEYDAMRRMTRARNDWCELHLKHDSLGNAYEEHVHFMRSPSAFVLRRDRDDFGFVTRLTYPSGRILQHEPDALNRIATILSQAYGAGYPGSRALPQQRVLLRNTYRGLRMGQKTYGNGTATLYAYDAAGRVTGIRHTAPQRADPLSLKLLYDASGNLRRQDEYSAGGASRGERYRYDSRNQLTWVQEVRQPGQPVDMESFVPRQTRPTDASLLTGQAKIDTVLGSLAQVPGVFTYRYDKLGNRLEERPEHGAAVLHEFNALNQEHASDVTYDMNGNLCTAANFRYVYTPHNQLASALEGSASAGQFRHDPLRRRFWSHDAAGESLFLCDGENVIEEYRLSANVELPELAAQYVNELGVDSRCHLAASGDDFWYLKDLVASTRALTNNTANVVASYRFSPFGAWALPQPVPVSPNSYLFVGRHNEGAVGWYDFRARHYCPVRGAFVQRDPLSAVDGRSVYRYAGNNPLVFVDQKGEQTTLVGSNLDEVAGALGSAIHVHGANPLPIFHAVASVLGRSRLAPLRSAMSGQFMTQQFRDLECVLMAEMYLLNTSPEMWAAATRGREDLRMAREFAQAERVRQRMRQTEVWGEWGIMTAGQYEQLQASERLRAELECATGGLLCAEALAREGRLTWRTAVAQFVTNVVGALFGNPKGRGRDPRPLGLKAPFGSGVPLPAESSLVNRPGVSFVTPRLGGLRFDPEWTFLDKPVWQIGPLEFVRNRAWMRAPHRAENPAGVDPFP